MIGDNLFEDMNIDAFEIETDMKSRAQTLIDHWGKSLTENDLLKLNAMVHAEGSSAEYSIAAYALEYYLTQDYQPEFIHTNNVSYKKKPWWKFW